MDSRFADTGEALSDLATHFVVHCPKCDGKASVDPFKDTWRLKCSKCYHVEEPGTWHGSATAYASVKCRECNETIRGSTEYSGQWNKIRLKCDHCGDEYEYDAKVTFHHMHNGLMCDSIFGLPLWLQKEFGNDLFWAFNHEHLQLLEDFISAKHRERGIEPRNTIRKNSSMASRLPEFIQKSGNRQDLINVIGKLRKK